MTEMKKSVALLRFQQESSILNSQTSSDAESGLAIGKKGKVSTYPGTS